MRQDSFQLTIQLPLPVDKTYRNNEELAQILNSLKKERFYGVELNIIDFEGIKPQELQEFLMGYGLKMTMVATGAFAKREKLSLSDFDEENRVRTVEALKKIILFGAKADAGVICGFIKGAAADEREGASVRLRRSLDDLIRFGNRGVGVYLEATNHYEAAVANTIKETQQLLDGAPEWLKVLPDTYHMNIEESDMSAAILSVASEIRNFHISDNNRRFPGYGALDFFRILNLLFNAGFQGTLAIEGNASQDFTGDIRNTRRYMEGIFRKIVFANT